MLNTYDDINDSILSPDEFLFSNLEFESMIDMNAFSTVVSKEEGEGGRSSKMEEELSGSMNGKIVENGIICSTVENHNYDDEPEKKKRKLRHTPWQVHGMEMFFKECPNPDEKQRLELSKELGLTAQQIRFWFQNKRNQIKVQQDKNENAILKAEIEYLKNDISRLEAAIGNKTCPNCSGTANILGQMSYAEQHNLRLENARLKYQLEHASCISSASGYTNNAEMKSSIHDMNIYPSHFNNQQQAAMGVCNSIIAPVQDSSILVKDQAKRLTLDLAITATEHLLKLCTMNEPLWIKINGELVAEVMNYEEYKRFFNWPIELKQQCQEFNIEATRDRGIVRMDSITLVDAFFDANKWMDLFPTIVSKAKTLQIITDGASGYRNGSLHLFFAEFQVLSPLVPTREAHFLRYCQHNVEQGTWSIVDFPIDGLHDGLEMSLTRYRRRPSGCIIKDMTNGHAMVTWVEHAELQGKRVAHHIFDTILNSGVAFGAAKWLSILQTQCERQASLIMARNIPNPEVVPSAEARKKLMKLSQRMIRIFCANISWSNNQTWTALPETSDDTIRVTARKNTELAQPNGVILTAVSTVCLPFSHSRVFELLSNEQKRTQFDALSYGKSLQEVAHIANGLHQRNRISVLRANAASNHPTIDKTEFLVLQESSTHQIGGSIVVYAPIDGDKFQIAMNGEDQSSHNNVPLLPTGFVVLPAPCPVNNSSTTGCLLTVGMQVLARSALSADEVSLSTITSLTTQLSSTMQQITNVLGSNGWSYSALVDNRCETSATVLDRMIRDLMVRNGAL